MIGLENFYNLQGRESEYDECWLVTLYPPRSGFDRSKYIHVPALAPSDELFRFYRKAKANGLWDESAFNDVFAPTYMGRLSSNGRCQDCLQRLVLKARRGSNIALVCFCQREHLCHRALIGGFIQCVAPDIEVKAKADYRRYVPNIG